MYHRYQKLQDNLLTGLIHHVRRSTDAAKSAAKERVYEHRTEGNENCCGHVLKLLRMTASPQAPPSGRPGTGVCHPGASADRCHRRSSDDPGQIRRNRLQWEHIDVLAHQFKRHLRPILLAVDVAASPAHATDRRRPLSQRHLWQETIAGAIAVTSHPVPLRTRHREALPVCTGGNGHRRLLPDRYEFWSTVCCATASKPAIFSAAIACVSGVSRMTCWTTRDGRRRDSS